MSKKPMRKVRDPFSQSGDGWIEVDPEECWKELRNAHELDRISYLSQRYFWDVILEDIDELTVAKKRFKAAFFKPTAARNREKAIHGISSIRNQSISLVEAARAYETNLLSHLPDEGNLVAVAPLWTGDDGQEWDAETIGRVFSRLLCIKGLKAAAKEFSNIAAAEKTREKRIAEGFEYSNEGMVWRAFCEWVLKKKSLPTRDELDSAIRERWAGRSVDESQLGRICKALGIDRTKPMGNCK